MGKKLTLEEVKFRVKKVNNKVEIVDSFYNGANEKMTCRCTKCNHVWGITYAKLMSKRGCPNCYELRRGKTRKLNMDIVKKRLTSIKSDVEIIDKKYINSKTKMNCRCKKCGNIWKVNFDKLTQKRSCPKCAVKYRADLKRRDMITVKKELKKINPNIKIIDEIYKNDDTKMQCKCLVCNRLWSVTWNNLYSGKGCPNCAVYRRSGSNNYKFNPNLTQEERMKNRYELGGQNIVKWRKQIFVRDNYRCKICEKQGGNLNAHHLNSYHAFPDERFKIDNGVTLCTKHHKEFHKQFGYRNNTKEQFEEYMKHAQ